MDSKKKVWFRIGAVFEFTDEELKRMHDSDNEPFLAKFESGDFILCDAYAPDVEYNNEVYTFLGAYVGKGYRYSVDKIELEF